MTHRILLPLLFILLFTTPTIWADSPRLRPDHPTQYTVQRGDTLWDIAARFLEKPWRWPDIWYLNPEIENPHLIYPGDTLELSYANGRPRLQPRRGRPTIKLSPRIRATRLDRAIPTIPISAIRPFLNDSQVLEANEIDQLPYVVGINGEHIVAGTGNHIYVRQLADPEGLKYVVLHPGNAYKDPQTGEILGYQGLFLGHARLQREGDPATLLVGDSREEIRRGDRLVPSLDEDAIQQNFLPRAPDFEISAQIISVLGGVSQIGQYQVVVISAGEVEGMQPGHVLKIQRTGATVRNPLGNNADEVVKLPDEESGLLMIFRPFERVSYALVMKATRAIHLLDTVRTP